MQETDRIQGFVARCLSEPVFLEAARAEPPPTPDTAAGQARRALGAATLERVASFRGHITRVQNNGLRRLIPHTLRLLERLDVDLPLFTAMSTSWVDARRAGPLSPGPHLEFFESQLRGFLKARAGLPDDTVDGVFDCLTHERTLFAPTEWPEVPEGPGVRLRGRMRLWRYATDPVAWCCAADWQTAALPQRRLEGTHLLYWRTDAHASTSVYSIDLATAFLLAAVDGRRSFRMLVQHVAARSGGLFDAEAAAAAYRELSQQGLVDLQVAEELTSPGEPGGQKGVSPCVSS